MQLVDAAKDGQVDDCRLVKRIQGRCEAQLPNLLQIELKVEQLVVIQGSKLGQMREALTTNRG